MALGDDQGAEREHELREEARYLHAALFNSAPSEDIVEEYVRAHRFYCTQDPTSIDLRAIVARKLDVEALELVLRKRHPALTRKFRILLYLAEVKPGYYPRLVNLADHPLRAWTALFFAGFRTMYKTLKGHVILRRHPVV